jgi:hypothetical protein
VAQHLDVNVVLQTIVQVGDESGEFWLVVIDYLILFSPLYLLSLLLSSSLPSPSLPPTLPPLLSPPLCDTNAVQASIEESVHALVGGLANFKTIVDLVLEWSQVDFSD